MNDQITIAKQYMESVACCDFQKLKQLLHKNYTFSNTQGHVFEGPDMRFESAGLTLNTFPDLSYDIQKCYQSGNVIIVELIMRGTRQGEMRSNPASDNRIAVPACSIVEIEDGLILSEHEYCDYSSLLQNLK